MLLFTLNALELDYLKKFTRILKYMYVPPVAVIIVQLAIQ